MLACVWVVMMAVWLGAMLYGVWWVWPHFEKMELTVELGAALFWLTTGATAWFVALRLGMARFWPRPPRPGGAQGD